MNSADFASGEGKEQSAKIKGQNSRAKIMRDEPHLFLQPIGELHGRGCVDKQPRKSFQKSRLQSLRLPLSKLTSCRNHRVVQRCGRSARSATEMRLSTSSCERD